MERVKGSELLERDSSAEQLKVFDELASIRILQEDLKTHGFITPESWQQVYNEELTYVAESINAPLRTEFMLKETPEGLVDERGVLLREALQRGLWAARSASDRDNRLEFNLRRAIHDYHEGEILEEMMQRESGHNTVVSVSPFCEEAYRQHGKRTVEDFGYQPDRCLGFIRVYQKTAGNQLKVISISVDNSNLDAFRSVLWQLGVEVPPGTASDDFLGQRAYLSLDEVGQETLPDKLVSEYDRLLGVMHGQEFSAGRPKNDEVEAWGFISEQQDLIAHYFERLEALAKERPSDVNAKRRLTYSFWASLNSRMKTYEPHRTSISQPVPTSSAIQYAILEREMNQAFAAASARHEKMTGCGGSIRMGASGSLEESSPSEAMESIMDDKKESWVWKSGVCRVDNCPTRPGKTKVGPCDVCQSCQHVFDKGGDPVKLYKSVPIRDNGKSKQKKAVLAA